MQAFCIICTFTLQANVRIFLSSTPVAGPRKILMWQPIGCWMGQRKVIARILWHGKLGHAMILHKGFEDVLGPVELIRDICAFTPWANASIFRASLQWPIQTYALVIENGLVSFFPMYKGSLHVGSTNYYDNICYMGSSFQRQVRLIVHGGAAMVLHPFFPNYESIQYVDYTHRSLESARRALGFLHAEQRLRTCGSRSQAQSRRGLDERSRRYGVSLGTRVRHDSQPSDPLPL